jgi:hypothetical protein
MRPLPESFLEHDCRAVDTVQREANRTEATLSEQRIFLVLPSFSGRAEKPLGG